MNDADKLLTTDIVQQAFFELRGAFFKDGKAPHINEWDAIIEKTVARLAELSNVRCNARWDAAADAAARKAMVVQSGFRSLLKGARERSGAEPQNVLLHAAVDQGEAIVGTLGDVIRNIAALKGDYPR